MRRLVLAVAATLALAVPAYGQGWRPEVAPEPTDAEWLSRLDAKLAPIHGTLSDTLALVDMGNEVERDAYIVIIQAQAAKGLTILDTAGVPPSCATDYVALERVMLLLFGDSADAWAQYRAGSSQAAGEVGSLVTAAVYFLNTYGDRLRLGACETPEPEPSALPSSAPSRTATPISE